MEGYYEKLGIQDFFNVIFGGAIFCICICWIYPQILTHYNNFKNTYKEESYIVIFVIFFVIGLIIQEVASFFDVKIMHIKSNVVKNFLKNNYNQKNIYGGYKNCIIQNDIKLKVYRNIGKKILRTHGLKYDKDFTDEQNQFIYSFCYYIIEKCNMCHKYEKMRGLFDMSLILCFSCIVLEISIFPSLIYGIWIHRISKKVIIEIILLLVGFIIFYNRAKKLMNYKARILMGTYEYCNYLFPELF